MKFAKSTTVIIIALIILSSFVSISKFAPVSAGGEMGGFFFQSGLPSGTAWTVFFDGTKYSSTSTQLFIAKNYGTYSFSVNASGYAASPPNGTLTINPIIGGSRNIVFTKTYDVTFNQSGLASGTNWNITLNGTTHSSTTGTIVFNGYPVGTYTYSIATPTNYVIGTASSGIITLTQANLTKPVTFALVTSNDWPMFHHNPLHTGAINGTGPLTNQTRWTYTTGAQIQGHPTVANGIVYVGSLDNYIYALDANTGEELWKFLTGDDVISAPAVSNGIVYVGSYDHKVYALNATTGKSIWNYTGNDVIESYPIVDDGVVYVGSCNIAFYALDAYTGSLIWQAPIAISWAGPAICDDIIYLGSLSNYVYALNKTDGTTVWSYTTGGSVNCSPAVVNGIVYVGCEDTAVYALNATTGERIWRYRTNNWVYSSPAVTNGVVYVAAGDHHIYALDAVTGSFIWNQYIGDGIMSAPAVVGGVVYIGSDDYNFYALNATDGSIIWTYLTGGVIYSAPAVVDGVLYVGSDDGKIYAFGTPSEYTLTINTIGQGSVSPGNITYQAGTIANLTAVPAAGWSFAGWRGDASGTENCTIPMNGNKTVTATFTQNNYTITLNYNGQGHINCNATEPYTYNQAVNLTAAADQGWSFAGWSDDASGSNNPYTLVMDSNKTVTATFVKNMYYITIDTIGQGSVNRNVTGPYEYSQGVNLTAVAEAGWRFSGWSGNASGSDMSYIVSVTGNITITATFAQDSYLLTVITVGEGTVSYGNQTYSSGTNVTLCANATTGWYFSGWSGDLNSGGNPDSILMNGNKTITATFIQETYTLTMITVGSGTVSPGNQSFSSGTAVDLKAMNSVGWTFSGWGGATSGITNTSITITSNLTVTATFTQDTYSLTIITVGQGTVSPGNQTCLSGTSIDIAAMNAAGWTFSGWTGDYTGSTNTTITLDSNMTLTATFTQNLYTLTIHTVGQGTVNPGNQTYLSGTPVDLNAMNAKGWTFSEWTGDASGATNTTITMDGDMTVTATFTINTYTLTVTQGNHGSISPANATIDYGGPQSFTITPDTGYHIVDVIVDGNSQGAITSYQFSNVEETHTITATFAIDTFTIAVTQGANGVISPETTLVNYGGSQTFAITANTGYHIVDVVVNGTSKGAVSTWEFSDLQETHSITASFAIDQFTITVTQTDHGTISPSTTIADYGTDQTFTVTPATGYHVVDVTVDGVSKGAISSWDFTNIQEAHSITVKITKNLYTINFTLSGVSSDYTGVALTVDGTEYFANALPLSFTWESGSIHNFAYASTLWASSDKRYVWASTTGLSDAQSGSLTITNAGTLTASFNTQYQLTVISAHASAIGSGWYPAGTYATAAVSSSTVMAGNDTRYVFSDWSGAGNSEIYTYILMDGPKTAAANWETQYQVTVSVEPVGSGSATSNSWMSAGTLALSATPYTNYTFTAWTTTGAVSIASSSMNPTTATVNGPGTVTANFNSTNLIATVITNGETYDVCLSGNVTTNQMSNLTITPHQDIATTSVAFTVTGEHGTMGFGNLTLSKNAIPYGTTPLLYIDGVLAENQGYTEDANNYYIWYTTHFSTHEITIEFTSAITQPQPLTNAFDVPVYCAVAIIGLVLFGLLLQRKKKSEDDQKSTT